MVLILTKGKQVRQGAFYTRKREVCQMSGYYYECKKRSEGEKCSKTISADSKEELIKTALHHMSEVHSMNECPGLKDQIRARIKKSRHAA